MKPKHHFRSISYLDHNPELYDKLLTDLQARLKAESNSSPIDPFFLLPSKMPPDRLKLAEELKKQIQEKEKSKLQERNEMKSPTFLDSRAYPNFPETPKDQRRKRLVESMKYVKSSLDEQLNYKFLEVKDSKSREFELEKKIREENLNIFEREKREKKDKKRRDKEILTESWKFAIQAKELQKKLEDVGRGAASVNKERVAGMIKANDTEQNIVVKSINQDETNRIGASKTRPAKLKKPIPGNLGKGYQVKIQKIIREAKQVREGHLKKFQRHLSP